MSIMDVLIKKISEGEELFTPSKRSTFTVEKITPKRVIVLTKGGWRIYLPAECFEAVITHLRTDHWMKIGAKHDKPDPRTLDAIIQEFTSGISAASYVAPLLEHAGLAQIDRRRPHQIRRTNKESKER